MFARPRRVRLMRQGVRAAYERFVETGDASAMPSVLNHNAADLATMAQLLCLLLTACDPGEA